MSINFEITLLDTANKVELRKAIDLGNSSMLRTIIENPDDYCGIIRISCVKAVQWLIRASFEVTEKLKRGGYNMDEHVPYIEEIVMLSQYVDTEGVLAEINWS